jgi:hypothetical protein
MVNYPPFARERQVEELGYIIPIAFIQQDSLPFTLVQAGLSQL